MKILIVGKTKSNQLSRIMEEAQARGHTVYNCHSAQLVLTARENHFVPEVDSVNLQEIDLIYLLVVGRRMWDWYLTCDYLHTNFAAKIVEYKYIDPGYKVYFTPASELVKASSNNLAFPKTSIIKSKKSLEKVLSGHKYPVIVKAGGGQRGTGVAKCDSEKQIVDHMERFPDAQSYMIREFIPNDGDIRVFTVGYKAIGAMKRTPKFGEFRSNISQGGTGEPFDLDANSYIREIAEKMSRLNHTEIAGVDIIVNKQTGIPYILEVNRGPQFQGLEEYTNINVALQIVKYFETK